MEKFSIGEELFSWAGEKCIKQETLHRNIKVEQKGI